MSERTRGLTEELLKHINIATEPPQVDSNKEFDRVINNIPYWEKDPRFLNPNKEPDPVLTWGMVANTPTIEKSGITLITATPGMGKSFTMVSLMLAVATCKQIGNFKPTNEAPARVIIFDTEQSANDIYRRIQTLRNTNRGVMPDNLRFVSLLGKPKKERLATIFEMVGDYDPDIVIVDTITRLTTDFNDASESQEFEDLLLPISKDKSVIGIMHHTTGTEKAKGHLGSIMEEIAPQIWIAKRKPGGIFTLKAKKLRNYNIDISDCFEVMLDPETGNLTDTTAQNAEQAETRKGELEELFKGLFGRERGGLRPRELRDRFNSLRRVSGLDPLKEDAIDNTRNEAVRCGVLAKKPDPQNKQHGIYFLVSNSDFAELDLGEDADPLSEL